MTCRPFPPAAVQRGVQVDLITFGAYKTACIAIGEADLSTILKAEQWVAEALDQAAPGTKDHRRHTGVLKLVRGRRQRLQQEARSLKPATHRA